jgi:cell wall-associated NlpC family hydrolase
MLLAMSAPRSAHRRNRGAVVVAGLFAGAVLAGLGVAVLSMVISVFTQGNECATATADAITLGPSGTGQLVGATEYGGAGDPTSGSVGSSGVSLLEHPDSYAELGGNTFQTATAMGGLSYMTALRITWGGHSAIAYKRDIGHGGGPVAGLPRVIDLWWQLAGALGIPYQDGLWSGAVRIERPPQAGAADLLGGSPEQPASLVAPPAAAASPAVCASSGLGGVPLTPGQRARLLANGQAAAPSDAPEAVKEIIAAGNQIVGKPYWYGGGHGLPLSAIAPTYDCSSSVEHLLFGARLLPVTGTMSSSELESFGQAGPGQWVTMYANADHVFMYVAGLRWDTHDAAGTGDGSAGIGWHPLVRGANGFVARHPEGL